jgi:hypothetical protein
MTSLDRGPAKIYAFPARGRFAADGQEDVALKAHLAPCASGVSTDSWYHEEAIREAEQKRKN